MKKPQFLTKLSAVLEARRKHKLRAATRAAAPSAMADCEDEPTTKLTSAFAVVLVLHVVAIAGIYAFNSIKASRASREQPPTPVAAAKIAAPAAATPRLAENTTAAAPASPAPAKTAGPKQHQVKPGENATKIAGIHGLKADDLLAANNLKSDAILRPGQMLTIPAAKPATKPDAPAKPVNVAPTKKTTGVHIVRKGDTATSIAKIYGLTAADLLKLNRISDAKKLQEGQSLTLPKKKG